jgi:hypothetical protein
MSANKSQSQLSEQGAAKAGESSTQSRIFIVDDHAMFREGLKQLIDHEPDLMVCGDAAGAEEALPALRVA